MKSRLLILASLFLSTIAYTANDKPIFHLKNKSGRTIRISLYANTNTNSKPLKVLELQNATDFTSTNTGIAETLEEMKIEFCDEETCQDPTNFIKVAFDYGNVAKGYRTCYIKFSIQKDGKPIVAPQEGGFFGKTSEGYSLKNNVRKVTVLEQEFIQMD